MQALNLIEGRSGWIWTSKRSLRHGGCNAGANPSNSHLAPLPSGTRCITCVAYRTTRYLNYRHCLLLWRNVYIPNAPCFVIIIIVIYPLIITDKKQWHQHYYHSRVPRRTAQQVYIYVHGLKRSVRTDTTLRQGSQQIDECRLSARWLPTQRLRREFATTSTSPCLPLFCKHSPDGATDATSICPYKCCLLLIYRPRRDKRLSWPSCYPHKWLAISYGSSVGQKSTSAIERCSIYWAMQPTGLKTR